MGWIALAITGLAAGAALWLFGVPRALASFTGAALMLGATGYALQGRPTLPATSVVADARPIEVDPGMVDFRTAILQPANPAAFARADAALRRGEAGAAVEAMLDAVRASPRDVAAWTGLANSFAVHDTGQMSPAAKFAFARAIRLNPEAPGPYFFLGMAQAGAGDFAAARTAWSVALEATPKDAPYREDIAMRLRLVEGMLANPAMLDPRAR